MISKFIKKGGYLSPIIVPFYVFSFFLYFSLYLLGFNVKDNTLVYLITISSDLLFLFLICRYSHKDYVLKIFKDKVKYSDIFYILLGLPLSFFSSCLYQNIVKHFGITNVASPMTPNFNIAYVILAILIAPIFEEFLCRGYVYDSKIGKLSPFVGITLSTFVFMAMHMTIYHLVVGFFLGIYLGYLRYRTDNLRLPILTHMAINILSLVVMYNYSCFIKFYQYFDVISICLLPFMVLSIYFKLNLEFFKQLKK